MHSAPQDPVITTRKSAKALAACVLAVAITLLVGYWIDYANKHPKTSQGGAVPSDCICVSPDDNYQEVILTPRWRRVYFEKGCFWGIKPEFNEDLEIKWREDEMPTRLRAPPDPRERTETFFKAEAPQWIRSVYRPIRTTLWVK